MSRQGRLRNGGQSGSPLSLFPFLAVLICTMGTLLLLLVVINRSARTQAAEQAGIKTEEILAELDIEAQTLAVFANDLQKTKELTIADIENERAKLASLESEIAKMERDIQQAVITLEEIRNNPGTNHPETNQLTQALAAKRENLRRAETELRELHENVANQKSTYAIIPYTGHNGTDRRPLYIECRKDCVVILPEGIVLREDDFLTASHPDNPLDAVLRAASLYYTENELVPRGTKPYPLIIVRPSGIDAYYAVRESIQSWGEQFGYELVEEDWKLEFPAVNEALKQRLEMQLAASRERMIPFKMMLLQQYERLQASGNRLQTSGFGLQESGGGRPSGGMPGGGRPGYGVPGNGLPSGGMPGQGMMGMTAGDYGNGQGGGFDDVDWQNVMAMGDRHQASGFRSQDSRSPKPEARSPNVEYRVAPGGNMVRYVDGVQSEARASSGNNRREAGDRLQTSDFRLQGTGSNINPEVRSPKPEASLEPTVMEPGQLYSATMSNGGQSGIDTEPFGRSTDVTGVATSGRYSDQTTMRNSTANAQQGGTQQMSPQENWLLAEQAARYHAENANRLAQPPSENASDSTQSPGMPQMSMTLGNRPPASPNAAPPPNWAIADDKQNAMEVTRPIVVECFPNKILIRRASGTGIDREVDIPAGTSLYHATDTLVSHIVNYIDTWGMAARGTYWQPEMIVTVQPGAEPRFEELQSVMHNSGVRIRRK